MNSTSFSNWDSGNDNLTGQGGEIEPNYQGGSHALYGNEDNLSGVVGQQQQPDALSYNANSFDKQQPNLAEMNQRMEQMNQQMNQQMSQGQKGMSQGQIGMRDMMNQGQMGMDQGQMGMMNQGQMGMMNQEQMGMDQGQMGMLSQGQMGMDQGGQMGMLSQGQMGMDQGGQMEMNQGGQMGVLNQGQMGMDQVGMNQEPSSKQFNYRFCPNSRNSWHGCGEYCISKYWPGNRPYRLSFCGEAQKNQNHKCHGECAKKYGPQQVQLDQSQFPHVKDQFTRYMIYCIMHYGY